MPYCTNCGEEVTENQRYCSYCGEPVGDHAARDGRRDSGDAEDRSRRAPDSQPPDAGQSGDHDTGTGGFEGDPPPAGYEDPPSVREPAAGASRTGTVELFSSSLRKIFTIPVALLGIFAAWFIVSSLVLLPPELGLAGLLFAGVVGLVAAGVAYVLVDGDLRGEETTVADAASRVFGQFFPLLAVWLLFVPVFLFGLSAFLLPGLYVGGRLLLAFPACVLDGKGTLDSLSTSWNRTRGRGLTTMGVLAFAVLTFFLLAFVLAIPQNIAFAALGVDLAEFETLEEALALIEDPQVALVSAFFQALALTVPVGAVQVAAVRLYRER